MSVVEIEQQQLAAKLEPYVGQWVAVRGDEVVAAAKTPQELLEKIDDPLSVDRIFRVSSKTARFLL